MAKTLKPVSFAGILVLAGGGRLFNLVIVMGEPFGTSVARALLVGVTSGLIIYHLVDLFLARGLMQTRIRILATLSLCGMAFFATDLFLLSPENGLFVSVLLGEWLLLVGLAIWSLVLERGISRSPGYLASLNETLPNRYLGRHPFRTFLESVFRLFPNPEPVGLYRVGNPDSRSNVIVTGNYELTIRRVARALCGMNCWLLVCDSRGINIWCATLAGHFGTDRIVDTVNRVQLSDRVVHRELILPQLSAANVSIQTLKKRTGFSGSFGPVRIDDIRTYRTASADPALRTVIFPASARLEMATGTLLIPTIVLGLVFNFVDPKTLLVVLPAVYTMAYLSALVFPHRFVRGVRAWSLVFSLLTFIAACGVSACFRPWPGMVYAISIGASMLYLINEFEGWSPLVKFSFTSAYLRAVIEIDQDRCIGCGACVEVCPRAVYGLAGRKSVVVNLDACVSCKSCIAQCPTGAIDHSAKTINEAFG